MKKPTFKERTGFDPVLLTPSLYAAAKAAGYDMSDYIEQKPLSKSPEPKDSFRQTGHQAQAKETEHDG